MSMFFVIYTFCLQICVKISSLSDWVNGVPSAKTGKNQGKTLSSALAMLCLGYIYSVSSKWFDIIVWNTRLSWVYRFRNQHVNHEKWMRWSRKDYKWEDMWTEGPGEQYFKGNLRCSGLTGIRKPLDGNILEAKGTGSLMEGVISSIDINEFK